MTRAVILTNELAEEADDLRAVYDERFGDPRSTRADRFMWDYWHVPGQYTALRTPAWQYFPKDLYTRFHKRLVQWGRRTLGCHDISPPWMSCYIEGCGQQFHGDLPHGPWAFVFSLTRWKTRTFRGGETMLLRDEVLDFWSRFVSVRGVEEAEVLRTIAPEFGRLTVFDPRIPHGVRTVTGTHDPREGRLVIHGWFVQPRPWIDGPLPVEPLGENIERLSAWIGAELQRSAINLAGLLSLGFTVTSRGVVEAIETLSDTTRVAEHEEPARRRFITALKKQLRGWKFPTARARSRVTLPLVFERED